MTDIITPNATSPFSTAHTQLVKMVREIVMDIRPIEDILQEYNVSPNNFTRLKENPEFIQLFESVSTEWNSALNTPERIRIKSAAMIEEWMPEAFGQLHNGKETLTSRVKLAELFTNIAGIKPTNEGNENGSNNGISININLGDDKKLSFNAEQPKELPPQVIDNEAT